MSKFSKFVSIWSRVSIIGIFIILAIIVVFMIADFLFNEDYGYDISDLMIVAIIGGCTFALYILVRRLLAWNDRS